MEVYREKKEPIVLKTILAVVTAGIMGYVLGMKAIDRIFIMPLYPLAAALFADVALGPVSSNFRSVRGMVPVGIITAVYMAAVMLGTGTSDIARLSAMLMLPMGGIALAFCQNRRLGGYYSAMSVSVILIVLLYAMLCLPGIISGEGAFAALQNWYKESYEPLKEILAELAAIDETSAEAVAEMRDVLDTYLNALPSMLAGFICLAGCVFGLSSTLLFYAFTRRYRDALGLAPTKRLRYWAMPKSFTAPMMLLYMLAFGLVAFKASSGAAVYYTVMYLVQVPLSVVGIAFIDYVISTRKRHAVVMKVFAFLAIALLYPLLGRLLVFLGMLDQTFCIRERREKFINSRHADSDGE